MSDQNGHSDELPPHSIEAEQGILASMLLAPGECIPWFKENVKAGTDIFYDLRHRELCDLLLQMDDNGEPIEPLTVAARIRDRNLVNALGGEDYISSLPDKVPSAANFGYYVKSADEKFAIRRLNQEILAAKSALAEYPDKTEAILRTLARTVDAVRSERVAWDRNRTDLAATLRKCQFNQDAEPPAVVPVYSVRLGDGQIISIHTQANLGVIAAIVKGGKSACLQSYQSAAIVGTESDRDTLGIVSSNPNGFALLHFDTEQAPADHHQQMQRVLRRAGVERAPEWLLSFCLSEIPSVEERRDLLRYAVEEAKRRFGGVHSTLIDGTADLVNDVNDQKECNPFVAELHAMAIRYAMPVINVIHLNPGSDKTRGHLGSQLERKSETNLRLEKEGEITTVWSDRQRRAPILKTAGLSFRWDAAAEMHVSCGSIQEARLAAKVPQYRDELDDIFNGHPALRYTDLIDAINRVTGSKSRRTAEGRYKDYKELRLIRKDVANLWVRP
jgi:hypothetical protein